jgi:hypothetical protein
MGATGICWDNSGAESLWSTFKDEYYYRHTFATGVELVAAVDKWMHFYNDQKRHSVIGMLGPSPTTITQRGDARRITPVRFSGGTPDIDLSVKDVEDEQDYLPALDRGLRVITHDHRIRAFSGWLSNSWQPRHARCLGIGLERARSDQCEWYWSRSS